MTHGKGTAISTNGIFELIPTHESDAIDISGLNDGNNEVQVKWRVGMNRYLKTIIRMGSSMKLFTHATNRQQCRQITMVEYAMD